MKVKEKPHHAYPSKLKKKYKFGGIVAAVFVVMVIIAVKGPLMTSNNNNPTMSQSTSRPTQSPTKISTEAPTESPILTTNPIKTPESIIAPSQTPSPVPSQAPNIMKESDIKEVALYDGYPTTADFEGYLPQFLGNVTKVLNESNSIARDIISEEWINQQKDGDIGIEITFTKPMNFSTIEEKQDVDRMFITLQNRVCYFSNNGEYQGHGIEIPTTQYKYFAQLSILNGMITANDALWVADTNYKVTKDTYTKEEIEAAQKIIHEVTPNMEGRVPSINVYMAEYSNYVFGYALDNILALVYEQVGEGTEPMYYIFTREEHNANWKLEEYGQRSKNPLDSSYDRMD